MASRLHSTRTLELVLIEMVLAVAAANYDLAPQQQFPTQVPPTTLYPPHAHPAFTVAPCIRLYRP